jgi:hypothetical protein
MDTDKECVVFIMELLSKMKKMKIVFIRFRRFSYTRYDPHRYDIVHPTTKIENIFQQFHSNEMAKNCELKDFFNWIQISKRIQ